MSMQTQAHTMTCDKLLWVLLVAGLVPLYAAMPAIPPSTDPPGGQLTVDQLPQFILFTHDDGVDATARKAVMQVTKGRETPNGCPLTATMFTQLDSEGWTSCEEVMRLYDAGYEIADHTSRHESLPGRDREYLQQEIEGARQKIAECGVPEEDIVGFRAPYLNTGPDVREVLHENGFLYDSSLIEDSLSSLSQGFGNRIWPWDMAYGVPINCSVGEVDGVAQGCTDAEAWPGLYEVPVWRYSNASGFASDQPYAMDPGYSYECECMNDTHSTFDVIKSQFDAAYSGNRAPLPIYIHIYWLQAQDNLDQLQKFVDYALTLPDVYFVTMRQLLGWMANPVAKDELTPEILGCGSKGGAPGTAALARERRRRQLLRSL